MEQKTRDWPLEHKLLLAFSLVLVVCGLLLGASVQFSVALILIAVLPGYLLSAILADLSDVERVIASVPASAILVGIVTLVPNTLFDLKTVDGVYVVFIDLLLLGWLAFKGSRKTHAEEIKSQAMVLGLTVLAFFFSASLIAYGSLNHESNTLVWSLDAVYQYVQISWMAGTHDNSVPPALNPFDAGLSNSYYLPASVVSQAAITQLSGANYWNVNAYFVALVFIITVLSVFLLFRKLLGEEAALVAAFAVIAPFKLSFAYPYYFGLWRVVFSLMLTPLVIYYCIRNIEDDGRLAWILAGSLLLLGVTQPLTAAGVALPVLLVAIYAILHREVLNRFVAPVVVSALVFAVLMVPLLPTYLQGGDAYPFKSDRFVDLSFDVEKEFGYVVGGTLIKFQSIPRWIPLVLLIGLALLWRDALNAAGQNHGGQKQFFALGALQFTAGLLLIFIASTGIFTFLSEYALKSRFNLFLDFVAPFTAASLFLAMAKAGEAMKVRNKGVFAVAAMALVLVFSQPWNYGMPTPQGSLVYASSEQPVTKPVITWDILDYLRRNAAPDSKILFLGFTQYTGCLAERKCFEVLPEIAIAKSTKNDYSRNFSVTPVCFRNAKKTGLLNYVQGSCESDFDYQNICNYDYLVIGHFAYSQYPNYSHYTESLAQQLKPAYEMELRKGPFTVHKKVHENENCLPAS